MTFIPSGKQKRTRTTSPGTALRELKQKRAMRGKKRQEEKDLRARKRAEAREDALLAELMAERAKYGPTNGQPTNGQSKSIPHDRCTF